MRAFITGTDTGVGKTFVTSLLTHALRRIGLDTIALKPLCSGDRTDAQILRSASDNELTLDEVNPVWFHSPVAPLVAARMENRCISMPALKDWFFRISTGRTSVLVEGAGGWLVPVTQGVVIADLCAAFALPVIIVTANRLGCVNHTLLTIENIRSRGLACHGIILNTMQSLSNEATQTNRALLAESTNVPILLEISPGQSHIVIKSAGFF